MDETDFMYRHWRQIEAGLIPQLLTFALDVLGPESIEDAWRDFHDGVPDEDYDPESPMSMLFMPWFLYSWIYEVMPTDSGRFSVTTITASFLSEHSLNPDEREFLVRATCTPYSLCEVVELIPGAGMTLFDLLRRVRYQVPERMASQLLKKGEIIYCATANLKGLTSNISTGPYALRPTAKRDVLELRKWIIEETACPDIKEDDLISFEPDIRTFYLDTVKAMFRPPKLANTDNDPLLPQKIYFDIESADAAFHALKDLAEGVSEDRLYADATLADGLIVKAEIPWLGGTEKARKRLGGPVLLGTINIENLKLIANVNSIRRAETIRALIEERLDTQAKYKTTLLEPIESEVEKMWAAAAATNSSPNISAEPGAISLADLPAEVRLRLEETARQHWAAWLDLPVPALNDMTPREATKTEEGRDLLKSLLLLYEGHIRDDESYENLMRPDIAALRGELGMAEEE